CPGNLIISMSESNDFKYSLCGCLSDLSTTCLTFYCPCMTAGLTANKIGSSYFACCLLTCFLPPVGACMVRNAVREKYALNVTIYIKFNKGSIIDDLICGCCCPCCSLVQTSREVNYSGDLIYRN
ncbi:hypothetical protein HZS_6721, partial [Henneguya salminicola]